MGHNKQKAPVTSSNQGEKLSHRLCEILYKKFTLKNYENYKECMTGSQVSYLTSHKFFVNS